MSFSDRMGLAPKRAIQTDDIDKPLRHRIVNKILTYFKEDQAKYILDLMGFLTISEDDPFNISFSAKGPNVEQLAKLIHTMPWFNVYDVIEYGYQFLCRSCIGCEDNCDAIYDEDADEDEDETYECEYQWEQAKYEARFNEVLGQEKSGFRLVDGTITPIIEEIELEAIGNATNTRFHSVNMHLKKALQLYSNRENPDYENSIKESISAVEAMCCIITGMSGASATLGAALKKLEENGVVIHTAMRESFNKLYGYTSDASGIRHGGIDFTNAPADDAKYMLVSCSAFVNYLIEKYRSSRSR